MNVASDAHFPQGGIFKFETPAGLLRDLRDRLVQRLTVKGEHVVAPGEAAGYDLSADRDEFGFARRKHDLFVDVRSDGLASACEDATALGCALHRAAEHRGADFFARDADDELSAEDRDLALRGLNDKGTVGVVCDVEEGVAAGELDAAFAVADRNRCFACAA